MDAIACAFTRATILGALCSFECYSADSSHQYVAIHKIRDISGDLEGVDKVSNDLFLKHSYECSCS